MSRIIYVFWSGENGPEIFIFLFEMFLTVGFTKDFLSGRVVIA